MQVRLCTRGSATSRSACCIGWSIWNAAVG
jgi:hypothetical protein